MASANHACICFRKMSESSKRQSTRYTVLPSSVASRGASSLRVTFGGKPSGFRTVIVSAMRPLLARVPSGTLLEEQVDVVGGDQIGRHPAVEVVLCHAALGEAAELSRGAALLRHRQRDDADDLGAARIVALIELVAAAELRADGVPEQLHQLDAIHGVDAAGAT